MSGQHPTDDRHGCGTDVAAYVLGALDAGEAESFERHLKGCVVCRDEVMALEHVVGALPMAADQHRAPRRLKRRVMRSVRSEIRAHAEVRSDVAHARPRLARGLASGGLLRPAAGAWVRPGAVAAAGLAISAAVVALATSSGGAPSARVIRAQVVGLAGSADIRLSGGQAELIVRHLAPPPAGHIYEVWLQRGHGPPMPTTALFSVTQTGAGDVAVPGNLHGVTAVLVTPEPAGGSRVPTHAPVIVAHLD